MQHPVPSQNCFAVAALAIAHIPVQASTSSLVAEGDTHNLLVVVEGGNRNPAAEADSRNPMVAVLTEPFQCFAWLLFL